MSAQCQNCSSPARDAFLCRLCTTKLRQMLSDLPWWISRLEEAAVSDTCMSSGTGAHGYQQRYPINGEHNIAHYLAPYPCNSDDLPDEKTLNKRYASARRQALAAGGVNDRASTLLDSIASALAMIVRDLCETRGLQRIQSAHASDGRSSLIPASLEQESPSHNGGKACQN